MKIKIFSICALIFIALTVFARSDDFLKYDDSENLEIEKLINITDQIKTSDTDSFKQNLKLLNINIDKATDSQVEYIKYFQIYEYVLNGDLDQAKLGFQLLFQEAKNAKLKIRTKATLANIQAISREYDNSLNNLDYALDAIESIDDDTLKNKINLISSIIYFLIEIYDMSLKYSELVINSEPEDLMRCKAMTYNLMSKIKMSKEVSEDKLHETIEICRENKEIIYANLLKLDWLNEELEKANNDDNSKLIAALLKMLKETENEVDKFGYNNLIGLKDMILAKAYYYNGQVDSAIEYANNAIKGSERSGNTSQVVDALKILEQEAIKQENYQKAYYLSTQVNSVESEIYSEAKSKQMAYMSVKHNNLAKQIEIQQLKQNNQLLALENKLSAETTKKQQLIMLLILSLLLFLGLWTFRIKRKHDYFKEVAEIDHLTQVFTRKAFEDRLSEMVDNCREEGLSLNLAIMDLDHFKKVNDEFGHLVGDWVLKQAVLTCEEVADQDIMMARLGGEEFCIVSPGISHQQMIQLIEKMRLAIEQMDCSGSGVDLNITSSFGVTSSDFSGYRSSMLLTHADLALFQAKDNGRNLVVSYASQVATKSFVKIS